MNHAVIFKETQSKNAGDEVENYRQCIVTVEASVISICLQHVNMSDHDALSEPAVFITSDQKCIEHVQSSTHQATILPNA